MRKSLVGLAALALLLLVGAVPAGADGPCNQGDMQGLVHAGVQGVIRDDLKGLGDPWANCQIRLYDGNDDEDSPDNPEVPNVYTDKEYFLAGIFIFEVYDLFDRPDYDRAAAIAFLDEAGTTKMFWGTADTPDSELEEIELTETNYQDAVIGGLGHVVFNHRYHIFEPGSLAPGEYKWRYEEDFPGVRPLLSPGAAL